MLTAENEPEALPISGNRMTMTIQTIFGRNFTCESSRLMMSTSAPIIRAMTRSVRMNGMPSA
ncbi:hypothetical protein DC31_12130 [Microbacterium sp. CH12i]|nr:hypothetical protein DC31_12130 [Microbacterium sp. CH12i]